MGSSEGADAVLAEASLVAGRYRVETQLGQGGMGSIYRVRDERSGKLLALKRLRASKSGSTSLLSVQFEREYHTLSQLAHPRIIEVFDYGVENGEPYYTMELLDGQDLFQRGKMTWRDACPVLCDVASSLAILHSRRLLHRDVSARNVRLTADGRAKLIDFGAMAPMGPVKHVVGTPPFLSPEALQRQSLDGRSDLYALGSLAYWLLTGHYAYPARSLEQLRELFGSTPHSPKQSGVDLPDELDRLVMDLLQLDRSQRPSSAAEVIERLSGIAGLSLDELPEVSKAYLSTPMLIGRDNALHDARLVLRNSVQGRGSTLLVSGDEGTGRSRFLDACVLEAKLLGATVLRADASDGAGSEFGIARELGEQLLETLPDLATKTARLWRTQLSVLLPRLAPPGVKAPAERDRHKLQGALRNWFLLIARTRQLVIAIDDFEDIDAASATFLAALGLAARRRRLSLILTHRSQEQDGARLQALRESARSIVLENLDLGETEALLHSVFGDIDHVAGIAARIYELSRGNPRWTMMLAETLVERRLARYEAGSWALPAHLSSSDLPDSITGALEARVLELPPEARVLAEALSLSEPTRLPVDGYLHLVPEATHAAARKALHVLLERQVLRPDESGYRFTQQEMCEVLRRRVPPERQLELHERLSRAALMGNDAVLLARHWLQCGRGREAIERLLPLRDDPSLSFSTRMLDVLQVALDAAEQLALPLRIRNELKEWLIAQAAALGRLELFKRYAFDLLERMERDSGLVDYLAADGSIPEATRLKSALDAALARYDALPAQERGLAPEPAALRLGRICSIITMMAAVSSEFALVERLPRLTPFFSLHPQLRVSQAHVNTQFYLQSGRTGPGVAGVREVLELIEQPECKLDSLYKNELRKSHLWMLALFSATSGAQAHDDGGLRELEQVRGMRVLAFRTRMAIEMALGNNEAAARCRKRAEVLLVEDAGMVPFAGTTAMVELAVYAAADDVVGTKRAMERLVPMAEVFPSWVPHLAIARAEYLRLQGDYAKALAVVEDALPHAPVRRHSQWGKLADLNVILLSKLGRHEEALRVSDEYRALAERFELNSATTDLMHSSADALTAAGRPEEALPLIVECMRRRESAGTRGVFLGRVLETRARVAIALRDQEGMHEYAERCAREYKRLGNAGLSRKYESLLREAEAAGLLLTTGVRQAAELRDSLVSESLSFTGSSRIFASLGSVERVEEGLRAFVEQSGGESGVVFAMVGGAETLELRASLGDVEVEAPMFEAAVLYVQQQLAEEEENTTFDAVGPSTQAQRGFTDSTGRAFEPTLLYSPRDAQRVLVGLALVHYRPAGRKAVRRELLDTLGEALMPATGVGRPSAPIGPPDSSAP